MVAKYKTKFATLEARQIPAVAADRMEPFLAFDEWVAKEISDRGLRGVYRGGGIAITDENGREQEGKTGDWVVLSGAHMAIMPDNLFRAFFEEVEIG